MRQLCGGPVCGHVGLDGMHVVPGGNLLDSNGRISLDNVHRLCIRKFFCGLFVIVRSVRSRPVRFLDGCPGMHFLRGGLLLHFNRPVVVNKLYSLCGWEVFKYIEQLSLHRLRGWYVSFDDGCNRINFLHSMPQFHLRPSRVKCLPRIPVGIR